MTFPSFGDAEGYALLGRACADAVAGPGAAFESCYHPVRPVGATLLVTLPFMATSDPVEAAYIALAMNVVFFAVIVTCLAAALAGDRGLLAGRPRRAELLAALAFVALLPNLVSVIPVRLADVPSMAAFAAALLVAVRTAGGAWAGRPLLRRYLLIGLLCALAVLVNVRYFVYAFVLLGTLLALDGNTRGARARCTAAFAVGLAPVLLQAATVFAHTGQVGLYDREFMSAWFPPRPHGIEAEFATVPAQTAYMVTAAAPISAPEVVALRLFRGLFGFEWSVYHGAPARGPVWTIGVGERAAAWAMVIAYFAFAAWVVRKGAASLRLLNLTAPLMALATALLVHTELRYYALPRSVLWLTVAVTVLSMTLRPAGGSRSAPPTA